MKKMTQKDVKMGIKRGLTLDEFLKKYEATEEEFRKALEKLYKYRDEGEKLFKQISDVKEKKSKNQSEELEEIPTEAKPAEPDTLDTLRRRETELSQIIMKLENDHVELARKHKSNLAGFREMASVLATIEEQIRDAFSKYEKAAEADNLIVEEMNAISESRQTKLTEIEQVRSKIRELTTVSVFVYRNGEIECDSELDDSGFETLFNKMLEEETFEDFRIKDVKLLARICQMEVNSEKQLEVVFEDEALQAAHKEVIQYENVA